MSKIIVGADSSAVAKETIINMLNNGFTAKTARISYSPDKGLPAPEDIDKYPLILEGTLNGFPVSVHVTSVTAGYVGTGSNAMVTILNAAGFKFEADDILSDKLITPIIDRIHLTYTR